MPDVRRLAPADARLVPWRNGRGVTRELAIAPPGASFERGDFDWRISAAAVTEPGPFSAFPGIDRVLVVTSGGGLDLDHGAAAPRAHVAPLVPYAFAGDWPTTAELAAGPVTDFNVLTRRGRARADVRVLRGCEEGELVGLGEGDTFLHLLAGTLTTRLAAATGETLGPGDSLWIRGARPADGLLVSGPGAVAIVVAIRSR
jgi:environmental stress-induced protein Ves